MFCSNASAMRNLPATGLTIAEHAIATAFGDEVKQRRANIHADLILLALQPIRSCDATAISRAFVDPQARNQPQDVERRPTDAVRAKLAWRMIRERHMHRLKVCRQLTAFVEQPQELKDIVGVGS